MADTSAILAHILSQTRHNVELLVAHKQISDADGREILSKLSGTAHSSVVSLTQRTQHLSVSSTPSVASDHSVPPNPAPPKVEEARAIWEWTSQDPNDLPLTPGEIVEVINETNADWWTGRNKSGRQGLFPSNYVEKLPQAPPPQLSPISFPEFPKSQISLDSKSGSVEHRYPSPAPPQHYSPQHYPPPPGAPGYYPPPGGPPPNAVYVAPPAQQPASQPPKKNKFGGLGNTVCIRLNS
ncbi:SH3 domain-containing protein [Phlebopus sp. FC_14]|nr:SH3 domain-containing protein [Phlebopus sp. FC_14]